MKPVFVTSASGNVGRAVIDALRAHAIPVRAGDRSPRVREGVESVRFDFGDPSTFAAARGCGAAFVLRPPAISKVKPTLVAFIDEARALGVDQMVFLSVAGAGENSLVPHHAVETHLQAKGGAFTLLRPGFFAQNFGDAYRLDIVEQDRVYVPAGRGHVTFVDVRDLAEVAARVFAEPAPHRGQAYTLTGPTPVDFFEATAQLSAVVGRTIRYEPASVVGYARHLRARGMPLAQIAVQTVLHTGLRFGQAERVDPTLERLLGHGPRSLRRYFEDHAALFR